MTGALCSNKFGVFLCVLNCVLWQARNYTIGIENKNWPRQTRESGKSEMEFVQHDGSIEKVLIL